MQLVHISKPKTFKACEIDVEGIEIEATDFLLDKDFWRLLYSSLTDDAMLAVLMDDPTKVEQFLKMTGFKDVMTTESRIVAKKPIFKAGGTSIRNRVKKDEEEKENPWGALSE